MQFLKFPIKPSHVTNLFNSAQTVWYSSWWQCVISMVAQILLLESQSHDQNQLMAAKILEKPWLTHSHWKSETQRRTGHCHLILPPKPSNPLSQPPKQPPQICWSWVWNQVWWVFWYRPWVWNRVQICIGLTISPNLRQIWFRLDTSV